MYWRSFIILHHYNLTSYYLYLPSLYLYRLYLLICSLCLYYLYIYIYSVSIVWSYKAAEYLLSLFSTIKVFSVHYYPALYLWTSNSHVVHPNTIHLFQYILIFNTLSKKYYFLLRESIIQKTLVFLYYTIIQAITRYFTILYNIYIYI